MSTIAGMDLGFGSQVKVVRTNFLVVNAVEDKQGTATQYANLLALYNQHVKEQAGGNTILECDYIIPAMDNGSGAGSGLAGLVAPSSGTDPSVVNAAGSTLVHLMGPSRDALAAQADLAAHQDEAAHIGTSANGKVLAVLSTGLMSHTGTTFTAGVAINLLGGVAGSTSLLNGELLADATGTTSSTAGSEVSAGMVPYIDIANLTEDATGSLTGTPTLDFTASGMVTNLGSGFVAKGNAAGTAQTSITTLAALGSGVGTFVQDTTAIISVVALMRTAQ